ncbi:MAG: ABC transporter substrate-binding protein [Methylococcales bacterium]|nr:ABC transporter substrate-binding protein [Methylococcales bacterium]
MPPQSLKKLFLFAVLGCSLGFFPASKVFSAELKAPQLAIENISNALKDKMLDENFVKDFALINIFVNKTIDPHVDFNRITALVLGKLWKRVTKEQKKLFKKEFHTLLVRTYSRAFLEFKDWSIRYLPLKIKENSKKIIVKTEILQPGIQPLAVNYRMVRNKRGEWKIYDIMIEGVSLVTNYRTSIKNEFKKSGSLSTVIELFAKRNAEALAKENNS